MTANDTVCRRFYSQFTPRILLRASRNRPSYRFESVRLRGVREGEIAALNGKQVKLRFTLQETALCSFWIDI